MIRPLLLIPLLSLPSMGQLPVVPSTPVEATRIAVFAEESQTARFANFRLELEYESGSGAALRLAGAERLSLPKGLHRIELHCEQIATPQPRISTWLDGKPLLSDQPVRGTSGAGNKIGSALAMDKDFTAALSFKSKGDGALFGRMAEKGRWSQGGKVLFLRGGKLTYDVGWVGAATSSGRADDGKPHLAVIQVQQGAVALFLDGKKVAQHKSLNSEDHPGHVFKIGEGADNFVGDLNAGRISNLRFWKRSLKDKELTSVIKGDLKAANTPDLNWSPVALEETFDGLGHPGVPIEIKIEADPGFKVIDSFAQPLGQADHARFVRSWNGNTLAQGKAIYQSLCITCHGDLEKEGSLPTAPRFHLGEFKNGNDPYRMFQTLEKGYGMMVAQPQYDAAEKYSVIQYIREAFLKEKNPAQLFAITPEYLEALPAGFIPRGNSDEKPRKDRRKPYEKMDFGPTLNWTYQVNPGAKGDEMNIVQKGVAMRLNPGEGGISKGKAWVAYDQDTMRIGSVWQGKFIDWKGIAFDGSHGTHTSIAGDSMFTMPDVPAWQHPTKGGWLDERVIGRDGRPYGPLPRVWIRYRGMHHHGDRQVVHYEVGGTDILETPGQPSPGIFTRTLNIGRSSHDLVTRLAPDDPALFAALRGPDAATLERDGNFILLRVPAKSTPARLSLAFSRLDQPTTTAMAPDPTDLKPLTQGGPRRFKGIVTTEGELGDSGGAFAFDTLTVPNKGDNPWHSWMRLGGFDFFADHPDRAAVCTWMGDVWLVDGVAGDLKELKWRRIASGLFQPLGLKIVDGSIYVTCRDQIAKLQDLNGDEEIDHIECFNNDHQVTEHFHEFAMGLQTDAEGNFYYAKSARHALKAVVPHHGTLLRVSPDGSKTDIVANGFRAANGVCLNPDGTWIVTDQEGHWNPKNRINYVKEGGFYGNMFGYHEITDESDSAMQQPLCWITNAFDRSPAELLWVPENASWGPLNGTLLNLSYGTGQVFTVPHEIRDGQAQGGMSPLPIEPAPSGLHRGRFHPKNGQLYAAGMFAWAGNRHADGGFHRIRTTGKPAYMPVATEARKGAYTITFSDALPSEGRFAVKVWDLKRTASYGSKHFNERELEIKGSRIEGNRLTLEIPGLQPTWGMEIRCEFANGIKRVIHASIHSLD